MDSNPTDESVLLSLLPELVWHLVLECLESHSILVRGCSKASPFFQNLLEKRGSVLQCPTILPRSFRDELSAEGYGSDELCKMLLPKNFPRLTTLHVSFKEDLFHLLSTFLERHSETLETVSIYSCTLYSYGPPVVKLPKMRKLRVFKVARWGQFLLFRQPFAVDWAVSNVFPELESLTLSLGGKEKWFDLLRWSEQVCPTVKHFYLFDCESGSMTPKHTPVPLDNAVKMFPNLVSVEIPARRGAQLVFQARNLKRLTLRTCFGAQDKFSFDTILTGYSRETCAAILQNLDPQQVIRGDHEGTMERGINITNAQGLEILRIRCPTGNFGPTLVTLADLVKLKSIRIWEFCGHKPKYIPDNLLHGNLTAGFKISWTSRLHCKMYNF